MQQADTISENLRKIILLAMAEISFFFDLESVIFFSETEIDSVFNILSEFPTILIDENILLETMSV